MDFANPCLHAAIISILVLLRGSDAQITSQVYKSTTSAYLPNSVMKTCTARSPLECVTLCEAAAGCLSCNFYTSNTTDNCELNFRAFTASGSIQLLQKVNATFYNIFIPHDCNEIDASGLFTVDITGFGEKEVYCDQGWLVVMRRTDSTADFHKNWASYKDGFGDPSDQFWLGNEALYALTNQGDYSMQIDMLSCDGSYYFVRWNLFRINDESTKYEITDLTVDTYNTSTNAYLTEVVGWKFHTIDDDQTNSCPTNHGGGWWFESCTRWHLTGHYPVSCNTGAAGMKFTAVTGNNCNTGCMLKAATMKIKRNS